MGESQNEGVLVDFVLFMFIIFYDICIFNPLYIFIHLFVHCSFIHLLQCCPSPFSHKSPRSIVMSGHPSVQEYHLWYYWVSAGFLGQLGWMVGATWWPVLGSITHQWNDSDLELHWAGQASALGMKGWGSNGVFLKFLLTLYVLCFSEGTKTYIYILCHSSTLTWHR